MSTGIYRRIRRTIRHRAALREFNSLRIESGDIAIDCGANVGDVTHDLRSRGARVYAFEPHPVAFQALASRFGWDPGVVCIQKAVHDHDGFMRLFLHKQDLDNPLRWSTGASLVSSKRNVDPDAFLEVEAIDMASFVLGLEDGVKVLKMDIEGAEYAVLTRLIETRAIDRIERLFVEIHDWKNPTLRADAERLRELLVAEGINKINLDWR